jgi:hypothetical protein
MPKMGRDRPLDLRVSWSSGSTNVVMAWGAHSGVDGAARRFPTVIAASLAAYADPGRGVFPPALRPPETVPGTHLYQCTAPQFST